MPIRQDVRTFFRQKRDSLYSMLPPRIFWEKEAKENYDLLMKSQWWDYEDLQRLQLKKLFFLLDFAYRYVPYQMEFKRQGAAPGDIRTLEDLKFLPVIDKSLVISRHSEFIPRYNFPSKVMRVSTSGSNSSMLSFYWHPDYLHMKSAVNYRFKSWTAKGWTRRTVKFGSPFNAPEDAHLSCRRNHALNTWSVNTADLSDAVLDRFVVLINTIQPDTLSGYPSVIHLLARHILTHGVHLKKYPSSILSTSEIIHDEMRTTIEKTFHARIYDWYGMLEGCASAGQCYFGNYHMNPECNHLEFIEQDGITRIVGTNLVNLAFPLPAMSGDLRGMPARAEEVCPT